MGAFPGDRSDCRSCYPTKPRPTLDEVLAAFGKFDFAVQVEIDDTYVELRYRVQVFTIHGDNRSGLRADFFKVKRGATVLDALAYIAGYHSELARLFE